MGISEVEGGMLPNGKRFNAVGDGKYHARAKDSPIHHQAYIHIYPTPAGVANPLVVGTSSD